MDSVAIRQVKHLPSAEKRSLENLVGRQLEEDQQVFILAFTPNRDPSESARQAALAGLTRTWEQVEQHRQKHGISDQEFEAAVDEATNKVRRLARAGIVTHYSLVELGASVLP